MYTRSYSDDRSTPRIPSGYDGTALCREPDDTVSDATQACEECATSVCNDTEAASISFFDRISGIFGLHKPSKLNIGFEEILIGAVAVYLFLSRDGDKECAIMLALLLIIT